MTLLARIDARIQRRFDAAVHVLMRRGVTKRQLRRNGWAAFIVLYVMKTLLLARGESASTFAVHVGFSLLATLYWVRNMTREDSWDEQAERTPNARSPADSMPGLWKFLGCLDIGFWVLGGWTYALEVQALNWAIALVFFYQGYLARTPPAAPKPKKERAPLQAVVST